ncbi:MAG: glycosyltransferase [bacterium]|nr:glycosyltransferase [bacterium]
MKIAFVGNQDNNAYRICRWIRQRDIDVHLYLFCKENPDRSLPELVDVEWSDGYSKWIHQYDDTGEFWALRPSAISREIDKSYDLVVTSGATGLLAAGHFTETPVVHLTLGSEVSEFPLWVWRRKLPLKWRGACFLMRRNLKRVAKVVTMGFRPELRALKTLGHADKTVVWGWPEDPEGNRKRVDRAQLEKLTSDYAEFDRVFVWMTRLNFTDPELVEYKGAERFLDAFERLVKDGTCKVKAIVGAHGYDVDAFKELVTAKGLDDHIDYVQHMPFHQMMGYLALPNGVVVDVLDTERGHIFGGVVREAMSVGSPVITAMDDDTIVQCYGPDCPIIKADDVQSCYEGMVHVAGMNNADFAQLGQSAGRWADEYLHYDRCVEELMGIFRNTINERELRSGGR